MDLATRSYAGVRHSHAHDFHQIVLPVAGVLEMEIGTVGGQVDLGCGAMIACGTEHGFRAEGDNRFVVLDLHDADLPGELLRRAAARPFFAIDAGLRHLARHLAFEAAEGGLDGPAAAHACGLLTHALARRAARPEPDLPAGIVRALAHLRARFAEPVAVADLARAAGMSAGHLHRRFRAALGRTPAEWLAEFRLDQAVRLLEEGRLPIVEVALACGYSDQTALTRSLRRRRGVTPAALRRAARVKTASG
jgi:AraC-like DNA-binding protein